ncbi:MAG: TrkA family potassium uptake protein [Anaerolineaceae bacterium]
MNIIVMGCGRVGSDLASELCKEGHQVSVVDSTETAFNNLPSDFTGKMVEGEMMSRDVLYRAGIEKADALAAVTNDDGLNAVVAHVAQTIFDVKHVIVRNYDPDFRPLLESFNLQVVSPNSWGSQRIQELILHSDIQTIFSPGNGEVEIYEVSIPDTWAGQPLAKLLPAKECIAVSIARAGQAMLPTPDSKLEECDVLYVSATNEGIESMRDRLSKPVEK